ncbi:ankyrin repeat-containing domain protein, partial [Baffinella frigidus]
ALWMAAAQGLTEEARQLLAGGANIEEQGGWDNLSTPIQVAVLLGHPDVVRLLLAPGVGGQEPALVNVKNHRGETPLHHAAFCGHEAVALLLLQHGADVTSTDNSGRAALHDAASQ